MLIAMRRGFTKGKKVELIDIIRQRVTNIAIRKTFITAYPVETEDDFQEMYDWVEETRFDRLGCFTYSHEENTHAHSFKDDVDEAVKQERADQIMELQSGISYELNQNKIGQTFKVLFDKV